MRKKIKALGVYWNRPQHAAYLFVLPALLVLLGFTVIPLIGTFAVGFFKMNIFFTDTAFTGFENFIRFFQDERALNALKNTLYFTIIETPMQVIVGLVIAVLISKNSLFNKFCRSMFFIPVVCSLVSIGIMWSMLLDNNIGIISYWLGRLGVESPNFFKNPDLAMPTVAVMTAWANFGVTMTILLAAIQGVSPSLYEAAEIDGGSKLQQFFHITIPQIFPALGYCMLTNFIGSMQVFDQVFVTTGGGPNYKTETIVQYIYNRGFSAPFDLGYASALSTVFFVIIAILSFLINRYINKKEEEMR